MNVKRLDPNNTDDIALLKAFVKSIPAGQNSFRYFVNRPIDVIQQHEATYLIIGDSGPVAYGHIENENDVNWLGIAVSDAQRGQGIGTQMMERLIGFCRNENITPIHLTVDPDNKAAIRLYEKFGFILESETEERLKFRLDLS